LRPDRLRAARPGGATLIALATFAAILAVAAFLRFYDLAANPGGLYPDEAGEGLDAWRLLHQPGFHADFGVWFPSDGGREALFAYVVAAVFNFAGSTAMALHATAAAFGVAGVAAIGWLGRRFGTWTGLAAAAWAAGSLWLVCVSRDGMRNTIVPLFGALALIALLAWAARPADDRHSGRWAALAGATAALASLYTYQPLKLIPVLIVVWVLWLWHADRATFRKLLSGAVPFAAAFLLVAAPMIAVAVTEPGSFFGRAAATSAFGSDPSADASPLIHVLRTLAMFGFTGDPNARHDVAGLPLLPLPLSVVAVAGLWRLWRRRRDPGHSLILLALPVFLVPPLIALEGGSPHFLRSLGLAAPLGVTIGLGAVEIVEQVRRRWNRAAGKLAIGAVAVILTAVAVFSGWAYLTRPPAVRYDAFSYDVVFLSGYAADHPGTAVIVGSYSSIDVYFLDASNMPDVYLPGSRIANPSAHRLYVALSVADIRSTLGAGAAARATPIAWDPAGKPTVWSAAP
jgi:hypothetical protein